jgi:diguanylate cyclase (GGDEF)-like protein
MFGTPVRRRRRPIVFMLVFGAFLAIVGVTAIAQIVLVSGQFQTSALNSVVGADAALVRMFVTSSLSLDDLAQTTLPPDRAAALDARLATLVESGKVLQLDIRRPDGAVIASSQAAAVGTSGGQSADFVAALGGESAVASILGRDHSESTGAPFQTASVLRAYFPLVIDGRTRAVVAVWRDAAPILSQIEGMRGSVVAVTMSAALLAALVLYFVFRQAQSRISRQSAALVEATQLDPLTGRVNHGALVDAVAVAVERSKQDGRPFAVALVDIDNFRLLNENHGPAAGDDAILAVARILEEESTDGTVIGRYGPDEFLVLAEAADVHAVEPALERVRTRLHDVDLDVTTQERLPLTFSAGICLFPEHADSVTKLLTTTALTLQQAKSSGGDSVLFAGAVEDREETKAFDVFQGLIIAVDTKDRYTKRHSEDVARYAAFLAHRLGLPPDLIATIRVAGLLHDIGKIGIPDQILRKPDRLTDGEYAAVKHHVALGDMIVRDLPDIDLVRAGIRHHHERWDGAGYLDHLAGEEIPLIARILAVGDTFSAMTTTRPYRKSLGLREALTRLTDAAGTQLEESLVVAFVEGIETDRDAPLPGMDIVPSGLWTPYQGAA